MIFKKFIDHELSDAINDYVSKSKNFNSINNKYLENNKEWKKLIIVNKFIISNYENYKKYLNYKLNDDISLDYSENSLMIKK